MVELLIYLFIAFTYVDQYLISKLYMSRSKLLYKLKLVKKDLTDIYLLDEMMLYIMKKKKNKKNVTVLFSLKFLTITCLLM